MGSAELGLQEAAWTVQGLRSGDTVDMSRSVAFAVPGQSLSVSFHMLRLKHMVRWQMSWNDQS